MTNNFITRNGINYIPVKDAALVTGYARDYISRLCREKKIDGCLIGKNWFVHLDSLTTFSRDVKIATETRNRELSRLALRQKDMRSSSQHVSRISQESDVLHGYNTTPKRDLRDRAVTLALVLALAFGALAAINPNSATSVLSYAKAESIGLAYSMHRAIVGSPEQISKPAYIHPGELIGAASAPISHSARKMMQRSAVGAMQFFENIGSTVHNVFAAIRNFVFGGKSNTIATETFNTPTIHAYQPPAVTIDYSSVISQEPVPTPVSEPGFAVPQNTNSLQTIIERTTIQNIAAPARTTYIVQSGGFDRGEFLTRSDVSGVMDQFARVVSFLPKTIVTREILKRQAAASGDSVSDSLEDYLPLGGGTLTGALVNTSSAASSFAGFLGVGTTTPGSTFSIADVANFSSATSTLYSSGGIDLEDGCFAVYGTCISGGGSSYTFDYPLLDTANTISLAFGTTTNNTWSGTNLFSGTVTLNSPLATTSGGTGLSSYTIGDILYASGASTLTKLPLGSAGQVLKVSAGLPAWGADVSGSGGSGAFATTSDNLAVYPSDTGYVVLVGTSATSTTGNILEVKGNSLFRNAVVSYDTVTAPSFTATSTSVASLFGGGFVSQASSTVVGLFNSTRASTTQLTNTGSTWLTSLASALLATDQNGLVIATTSVGADKITGSLGTINGTTLNRGDSITITAASSTLLANVNTWTGLNTFANATTTLLSGTTAWFTTVNAALVGNASTATALETARTINGVSFDGTANITVASTTLLANSNTWSGVNAFGSTSAVNATSTNLDVTGLMQVVVVERGPSRPLRTPVSPIKVRRRLCICRRHS